MKNKNFEKLINFALKLWKKIDKDDILSEDKILALDIFKTALYNDENIKYLSPINMHKMYIITKHYVLNKEVNAFIVFDYYQNGFSKLTLANGQYNYVFEFPSKTSNMMKNLFEEKVEEDRNKMEEEILGNTKSRLNLLLNEFKDKLSNKQEKITENNQNYLKF